MRQVALVSCSETKRETAPGETMPACELYAASDFFRMQMAEATARCGGDVFILSAEHCLVALSQQLATYDKVMAQVEDAAVWADKVLKQLSAHYPGEDLELLVFAGADYVGPLREPLPAGWRLTDAMPGQTMLERRKTLKAWRVARERPPMLELPCLAVRQPGGTVYSFSVDGKLVHQFAAVARVRRAAGVLEGYQRLEAYSHIGTIRGYLETAKAILPNAVVIAFDADGRVTFTPSPGTEPSAATAVGTLHIPLGEGEDWRSPGWIVDGQQRLAAVRDARVDSFPILVSALMASPAEQAEHFIRVNAVKPLPSGLIYSLLPHTQERLSPKLEAKRVPALLVERLNEHPDSPLRGMIATMTNPTGVAKDTSFLGAMEDDLRGNGALYALGADMEAMQELLFAWWGAVQDTFPREWGKKPKECRLFHGAGITALHHLMSDVVETLAQSGATKPTRAAFAKELRRVKPDCAWMDGEWGFGVPWNKLQNTSQHKRELGTHLATLYRERARGKRRKASSA